MTRILFSLLTIVFLGVIQVSFLAAWPMPVHALQLIVTLVIFITTNISYRAGLYWAFGSGLLLELYTLGGFGLATISLLLMVVVVHFLFVHFFTNRSLYPILSLGVIGTVSYTFFSIVLSWAVSLFGSERPLLTLDYYFWFYLGWQIFLNTLILFILFIIFRNFVRGSAPHEILLT